MARTILNCDQVLPCSTPAHIYAAVRAIYEDTDHNHFASTIQLADGSYDLSNGAIQAFRTPLSANQFYVKGNLSSPESVSLINPNGACIEARDSGILTVAGVTVQGRSGLDASQMGVIDFAMINFATCGIHQSIRGTGSINCSDGQSSASKITGSAAYWLSMMGAGGNHSMGGVTVKVSAGLTFLAFVRGYGPSMLNWGFNYFSKFDGSAATITGAKHECSNGMVMALGGTALPGY